MTPLSSFLDEEAHAADRVNENFSIAGLGIGDADATMTCQINEGD